jgi:hypothetical protein
MVYSQRTDNSAEQFSSKLRIKLALMRDGRSNQFASSSMSIENARAWFKDYLIKAHSIIRASVPLMEVARHRCTVLLADEKNPLLLTSLASYFERHIKEETGHDEWLIQDLEVIGVPRRECLERVPSQVVAELVGSQYYWINHWHPVSLLGYIAFLEGNPPSSEWIQLVRKITDYPEEAFRTIIKHSELDQQHRDDLNDLLDELPLTSEHQKWVTSNALYSAGKFHDIWNP